MLPDYPNRAFADTVTVRRLLTHTAGAGDVDELFGAPHAAERARLRTPADVIALHGNLPPEFAPGTQQKHGNYGYVVPGRIVEVLSGQDFESCIRTHVLAPAAMARTGFVDCDDPAPDLAAGHAEVEGKRVRNCATLPARGYAAGGQVAPAAGRLLPPPLFRQATTPQRAFMGLGFFATGYGEGVPERDFRRDHGGSADGICTDVRTDPHTGETVIVLSNRDAPACYAAANLLHAQWKQAR